MSNDGLSAIHTLVSNWFGNDKDGSLSDWANRKALETASFQYLLITHIALKIQFDLCRRDSPGIHLQRWCLKNLESRKRIHRFGQGQTSCARLQFPGHYQTLAARQTIGKFPVGLTSVCSEIGRQSFRQNEFNPLDWGCSLSLLKLISKSSRISQWQIADEQKQIGGSFSNFQWTREPRNSLNSGKRSRRE